MNITQLKTIIARRLTDFRKMLGLSQEQLAKRTNWLTKSAIEKFEKAEMVPSPQSLARLALALDIPKEELLRPYLINVDYDKVRYRKRSKMPKKQIEVLQRKYMLKLERYIELEQLLQEDVTFDIDFSEIEVHSYKDAQHVARLFREKMGWGLNPIISPIQQLEKRGVKVFVLEDEENNEDFDGMCYKENGIAVVILKKCENAEHDRFTLFHEMGHLLMNTGDKGGKELEALCNAFASEMLMPESEFRNYFKENSKIYPGTLQMIQHDWGISTDAQMYKAKELGIISENRYIGYCVRLNRNSELKNEMKQSRFTPETTDRYKTLVFRSLDEYKISVDKAANMLGIAVEKLNSQKAFYNA